ncbi:hypothetical protein ACET3Z_006570 [Daucus carota]|nr:PREDICTED: inactive disease resistance protein RPS4-like isoform X1 [Daucus carota subsp. sativus]
MLKILPDIESSQIPLPLQKLDISETGLTSLPSGIIHFSNLKSLELNDCIHLLSIIELPPNLKYITANGCTSLETLPHLSNLKQLEELDLAYCSGLTEILGLEELSALEVLQLTGCSSTLVSYLLTKRLFQIYSEFGHSIHIYAPLPDIPDWISQSSVGDKMCIDLPPIVSYDFLGMILCFKHLGVDKGYLTNYSVKNRTSDFIWRSSFGISSHESLIVIVPRSIFSVRDGDDRIELTTTNAGLQMIVGFIYNENSDQ